MVSRLAAKKAAITRIFCMTCPFDQALRSQFRATDNEPLDGMTRAEVPAMPMQRGPDRTRAGGSRQAADFLYFAASSEPFGRGAGRVGFGAGAGELAFVHDQVLGADRLLGEVALENFARAGGVACLRGERTSRDMRCHAVMRHGAPRVLLGRGLGEPDVTRVACELTALQRPDNRVAVADLAARRVHDVAAALHHADQ